MVSNEKTNKEEQPSLKAPQLQTPAPSDAGRSPGPSTASEPPESSGASQVPPTNQASASSVPPAGQASASSVTPTVQVKFDRDSTRPEDYAPGERNDDYDSNGGTDPDSDTVSMQDAPIEHIPTQLPKWVRQIIREACQNFVADMDYYFSSDKPNHDGTTAFFVRLNQEIRAMNIAKHANSDIGLIPERTYATLCQTYQDTMNQAMAQKNQMLGWEAWNSTHDLLTEFNKRHLLPRTWNLSEEKATSFIGISNPRTNVDSNAPPASIDLDYQHNAYTASPESENESLYRSEIQASGLDALEARARQQQRQLTSAKVMYWWPKGTGTQIFVRYGDRSDPIYRIRAGSHESYDRSRVERVLISKTRGTAKVLFKRDGILDEGWKYDRQHVEDFIGVGWKVEDDDESDIDALSMILPAKGAVYPQTRILVKWKDGVYTLEGRAFIRRATSGSSLDGDKVLYQKAYEMESAYRAKHGLNEIVDDESDSDNNNNRTRQSTRYRTLVEESSDSSDDTERRRRIRMGKRTMRSAPPRSALRQPDIRTDKEDENINYTPTHRHRPKQGEKPSRKSEPLSRRREYRPSTRESDNERIRKLEDKLRKLRIGKSKPQPPNRRSMKSKSSSVEL